MTSKFGLILMWLLNRRLNELVKLKYRAAAFTTDCVNSEV